MKIETRLRRRLFSTKPTTIQINTRNKFRTELQTSVNKKEELSRGKKKPSSCEKWDLGESNPVLLLTVLPK
jgi:hypothetical protein